MRKIIISFVILSMTGCRYFRAEHRDPGKEWLYSDSGIVEGITQQDYDRVHNVSFKDGTAFIVKVNDRFLNQYEYRVDSVRHTLNFEHEVSISEYKLIVQVPWIPVAPTGSKYLIIWGN